MSVIRASIFGVLTSLVAPWASAQVQLDPVLITATIPVPIDFTVFAAPPTIDFGYLQGQAMVSQVGTLNQLTNVLGDIRCVGVGNRKSVTSLADLNTRWLAASDVYLRVHGAAHLVQSGMIGRAINPTNGVSVPVFTIIYADGGQEKWLLQPSPMLSIRVLEEPFPNSLKAGDGIIKPSPSGCTVNNKPVS